MDTRLAAIPRHHGLKIFHNGLADLARFTALEYRNMMRVMPFKTRKLAFTEREKLMKSWAKDFVLIGSILTINIMAHLMVGNAETFEFLHKAYIKDPYLNELKVREGPPEIIDGLEHFLEALSEYLKIIMPDLNDEGNIIDMETAIISLYEPVRLTNGKFVRATLSYNNLPMFNDISLKLMKAN
ncbi:unnamed protein product [Rhizophagus irregularis]|nr:unnamed protein product [Rhizophagus irregularis]